VRVILQYRVRGFIRIGGNTFRSSYVNECFVAGAVRFFSYRVNRREFFGGIQKTFVATRNVIVHLDSEDMRSLRIPNNLACVLGGQSVSANTNVIGPVLLLGI